MLKAHLKTFNSNNFQVLWVLHKSGMEDLLLFIASSDDETQYCLHVLEIISLMFREQVSTVGRYSGHGF